MQFIKSIQLILLEMFFTIQSDNEREMKKIAGPEAVLIYARQINGNFVTEIERNVSGYYYKHLFVSLMSSNNIEGIYKSALENDYDYVILPINLFNEDINLSKLGLEEVCKNATYILYKIN